MKRIAINLSIALRSLYSFKLRTALAVLGVFLGTFSLIVVTNLSSSLAKKAEQEVARLGKNVLVVRSGTILRHGGQARLLSEARTLTRDDAVAILNETTMVSAVSPSSHKTFPIRFEHVKLNAILVTGVTSNFTEVRNFRVKEGVFFSDEEDERLERVAVLGKKVADKLFGDRSPLGWHILVFRVPCRVIGVMEEKGVDASNVDQDNQVFVPLDTFLRRLVNQDFINTIYVQTVGDEVMARSRLEIEELLRRRHKIRPGQKDDFAVIDMKDVVALKTQAISMISVLGRIAAGVSFTIGALGILSIMILIVSERRMEIGIRRAVGSRKRDIVLQFLIESSFISLLGGVAGVLFGFIVSVVIYRVSGLPFAMSPLGLEVSFAASVGVGILAGIYPSKRATAIQPVDVIRS
ncbi:MAG: ABC transporter permease [Syntrophobacteraceae bacterium]|jgi:putative ABC transport system permease protein|nr:ABC transporter permease [Syntrophobacteraceae bacterium]MCU0588963.1 ABC transporter permease [Syntrophobacteraceae bacterium]